MLGKRYFLRVALAAGTIGLFVFLGASAPTTGLRSWALDHLRGVMATIRRASDHVSLGLGRTSAERASELEQEKTRLLRELATRQGLVEENAALRQVLNLRSEGARAAIMASVLGYLNEGREELLLIDRGANDGIAEGDVVVSLDQVFAGLISDVSPRTAHVLLITSPSRSTDVSISGRGIRAVARGVNNRELAIDLVPQQSEVRSGDLIVASPRATGLSKPLLVGEVREVKQAENDVFKSVRAIHLFDPGSDRVMVLRSL